MSWYGGYKPYVPVAKRRAQAAKEVARRFKNGEKISPVVIEGRALASSFWGKAWGANLESYSDFANRLPRGRTYARNGSVVHLSIAQGRIKAMVSGSELYDVQIQISPLPRADWQALKRRCAGQVGTIVELLQGKLSEAVMQQVTDRDHGLFPKPVEIKMECSCPDYAGMCKHVAAVMYGVGNRLDRSPELLFQLRGVDQSELIAQAIPANPVGTGGDARKLADVDLGSIFGIEIDEPPPSPKAPKVKKATKPPAPVPAQPKPQPKPIFDPEARARFATLSRFEQKVMMKARLAMIADAEQAIAARPKPTRPAAQRKTTTPLPSKKPAT